LVLYNFGFLGYGLKNCGIVVQFPAVTDFFSSPKVQTGSVADLMFCLMGTKALASGIKRPGCEAHK